MRLLQMDRNRIVQAGLDALGAQGALQARRGPGCAPRRRDRRGGGRAASAGAVDARRAGAAARDSARACCAPRLGPAFEVAQLDAQDGALNAVHAVVEALQHVVVALLLAPVAQHADRLRLRCRRW